MKNARQKFILASGMGCPAYLREGILSYLNPAIMVKCELKIMIFQNKEDCINIFFYFYG